MDDTCRYCTRSYRAYQTDILNILITTDILQSKVLLTPTWSEIHPNDPKMPPKQYISTSDTVRYTIVYLDQIFTLQQS